MDDEPALGSPTSYWYADDRSVAEVLEAVRRFRRADQEMRRRLSAGMDMNETDLQALQFVIGTETRGGHAHPREIAAYLRISTASTTKLLDRLDRLRAPGPDRAPHRPQVGRRLQHAARPQRDP